MNQVFVSNHSACLQASDESTADFSTLVHTVGASAGHAACMVGLYCPSIGNFLDGKTASVGLLNNLSIAAIGEAGKTFADVVQQEAADFVNDTDGIAIDTAADEAINVKLTSPQFLNHDFQIVQAMKTGNPVASPIIHSSQLRSLTYSPNVPPVKHKLALALDAAYTPVLNDEVTLVLNVRWPQGIAFYESQINASTSIAGVGQVAAAFDNPQRIYKASITVDTATDNAVGDALVAAINASSMGDIVTASDNSTTGIFVEADFYGVIIDATIVVGGTKVVGSTNNAAMKIGVGSFAEVVSAEKAALYSQGVMNRMYFPTGEAINASTTAGGASTETATYDRIVFEYENRASRMPGFNGGGNMSTATLYIPANSDLTTGEDTGASVVAALALGDQGTKVEVQHRW